MVGGMGCVLYILCIDSKRDQPVLGVDLLVFCIGRFITREFYFGISFGVS